MLFYRVTPNYRVTGGRTGAGVTHGAIWARVAQDTGWPRDQGLVTRDQGEELPHWGWTGLDPDGSWRNHNPNPNPARWSTKDRQP
jgi:hypothetical protein